MVAGGGDWSGVGDYQYSDVHVPCQATLWPLTASALKHNKG